MNAIQLEFNLDNLSPLELKLEQMQKQMDTMLESQHKVRKKLFAKVGALEKKVEALEKENENVSLQIEEKNEFTFDYEKKDCLFDLETGK